MPYDPSQPRIPSGNSNGGEWTSQQLDTIENSARLGAGLEEKKYPGRKTLGEYIVNKYENIVDNKYILYHVTPEKNVDSIKNSGLNNSQGYSASSWYMLTTSLDEALTEHMNNFENAVALKFEIPVSELGKYIWGGVQVSGGAVWHAPKEPIPGSFITKIIRK